MCSDNRALQRHACGLQVFISGWPAGLKSESRLHMLGWMLAEVPEIQKFLEDRGNIYDHTAHEFLLTFCK